MEHEKFAKIIELPNGQQVLITKGWFDADENLNALYMIKQTSFFDSGEMESDVTFYDWDCREKYFNNYGIEEAENFVKEINSKTEDEYFLEKN